MQSFIQRHYNCHPDYNSSSEDKLQLITVAADGSHSARLLAEHFRPSDDDCCVILGAGRTLPDGRDGVIAEWTWEAYQPNVGTPDLRRYATRVAGGGATLRETESSIELIGDNGTAFVSSVGTPVTAIDIETWSARWTAPVVGRPVMAVAGGGVALHDSVTGALTVLNNDGLIVDQTSIPLKESVSVLQLGSWEGVGVGMIGSVSGPEIDPSPFAFLAAGGSESGQNAPSGSYSTIDRAAIAALRYYNPVSIDTNREYGGHVCLDLSGRYVVSVPNRGVVFSDNIAPSSCRSQETPAARYHTHGRYGNDGFSSQDIANADAMPALFWYVATPCGNIDKYRGPNVVYERLPQKTATSVVCAP